MKIWILFGFVGISGCGNAQVSYAQDGERISSDLHTLSDSKLYPRDALTRSIRRRLDIDVYSGSHTLYIEWDEKGLPVAYVTVRRESSGIAKTDTVRRRASEIGHRWNWYVASDLQPDTPYRFTIDMVLQNGKHLRDSFRVKTRKGNKKKRMHRFRLYDDIEGGSGDKEAYLRSHTKDGTMRQYGLYNSAMYWVDDFYRPIPDLDDSRSRLKAAPQKARLQALVRADMRSQVPHVRIDPKDGIVVLDIEHVPSVLEYVTREYSPYGAFVSKYIDTKRVRENGRRIVLDAIDKKLQAIAYVKALLPDTPVGLWNSVVLWNRYDDNAKNRDDLALAKGTETAWRITYPEWHPNDSLIYKRLIEQVDYVMPLAYPMFDLRTAEGRRRQQGYILSKFQELRRIDPDVTIIPSISPHYTEGWTHAAGLYHRPMSEAEFGWYLNLLYGYYQNGLIDSVHIWADNDGTRFSDFVKQGWWRALLDFTSRSGD